MEKRECLVFGRFLQGENDPLKFRNANHEANEASVEFWNSGFSMVGVHL